MPRDIYLPTLFAPIDREHLTISQEIGRLLDAVNGGDALGAKLECEALLRDVRQHFLHEERFMRETQFPNEKKHLEAHRLFVADLERYFEEVTASGLTDGFRRWAIGRLPEWFRVHILAHDMGLAQFLRKTGADTRLAAVG